MCIRDSAGCEARTTPAPRTAARRLGSKIDAAAGGNRDIVRRLPGSSVHLKIGSDGGRGDGDRKSLRADNSRRIGESRGVDVAGRS